MTDLMEFAIADAMRSFDDMLVYADWLEECGDVWLQHEIRSVAWLMRQVESLLPGIELNPTGSRLYGEYSKPSSDWDFYAQWHAEAGWQLSSLQDAGWTMGGSHQSSWYRGCVNLIMLSGDEFLKFGAATEEAKSLSPKSREEAIAIFEKHGAGKTAKE